jgi:hypothetical protein
VNAENTAPLPVVASVKYPTDREVDDQLHERHIAAIEARDLRAQAEARLDQAHRDMVKRDAILGELVAAAQAGDGHTVHHRAPLYALWHGYMERDVEEATRIARRLSEPIAQQEAER